MANLLERLARAFVWTDYLIELNKIKNEFINNQNYLNAKEWKNKDRVL